MRKTNENNIGGGLRTFRTLSAVLSVLLVLLVGVACDTVNSGDAHNTEDNTLTETKADTESGETPSTDSGSNDGGENPSINPAYNTVSVNGVPVYSYDGYMNLSDENGSSRVDEETNKLIKDDSNKGKVYRITISKKLIDSSADDTEKWLIEPTVLDYNDSYSFEWKDKVQETVGKENSNIVVVRKNVFTYLRNFSIGDVVPIAMTGQVSYIRNITSMDKYSGTYDEHEGYIYFDAIIEFEITE